MGSLLPRIRLKLQLFFYAAVCPAYFILDFITIIILGEEYKIRNSSLYSFIKSSVTTASFFFCPNTPLSTVLRHPLLFIPYCGRKSSTPVQNSTENYSSVCLSIFVYRYQMGRQFELSGSNCTKHSVEKKFVFSYLQI
jgi:hypothetical protein